MRVKADGRANVGVLGNEVHHGPYFRFAGGVGAGTHLFVFLAPEGWKVAVQIQTFDIAIGFDVDTVIVLQTALGHHAVVLAAKLARKSGREQSWLVWIDLPTTMGIWNSHHQNATIAVHVLNAEAFNVGLVPWVGPCRRTNVPGFVCHGQFSAIRV